MQVPSLPINDRFVIELVCDKNYSETLEVFLKGHELNPFLKAVKATKEEISRFYSYKFKAGIETRPLQQFCVRDTQNNNKIVGSLLTQHFSYPKAQQKQFKEGLLKTIQGSKALKTRFDYDILLEDPIICKQFLDEIEQTQNPFLYQQACISVLPEYFKYGLFLQMTNLSVYTSKQMNSKGYVDIIHNHGTGHVAKKYFGGKVINEIQIRDHYYEGKKVFDTDEHIVQLVHSPLNSEYSKKIMSNDEQYLGFYLYCSEYIKYQNQLKDNSLNIIPQEINQQPVNLINNISQISIDTNDEQIQQQWYRQNISPRL